MLFKTVPVKKHRPCPYPVYSIYW